MTINEVNKIKHPNEYKKIYTCPYDNKVCDIDAMQKAYNAHLKSKVHKWNSDEDYMGVVPVCSVCALHKVKRALEILRVSK